MKIGIIGFGKMGMLHGALLSQINDVKIAAIVDTSKLVLRAFKSVLPNIQYFTSHEKMLDAVPLDAVVIATPSFSHVPLAKNVIERNLHLFIEKPLSNNLENARELDKLVRGKNIVDLIGYCLRYVSSFVKGREIISSGKIGKILSASAEMYIADVLSEKKGWRFDKNIAGGGVLMDFGIHMVDLLFWYFGEVCTLKASSKKIYSRYVEDEVQVDILFKSGVQTSYSTSWSRSEYRKSYSKISINGEKGSLEITDQTVTINSMDSNGSVNHSETLTYPDLYAGYYMDIGGQQFSLQMETFINLIREKRRPECNIESGLYIQKIVDAIYLSSRSGDTINVM